MEILLLIPVIIIGTLLAVAKAKVEDSGKEKARSEWDAQQNKYEDIVRKLPSDLVDELLDLLKQAATRIRRVIPDSCPEELMKMALATDAKLNLGIVLLHFSAVASQWAGKLVWQFEEESSLSLPEGYHAVASVAL